VPAFAAVLVGVVLTIIEPGFKSVGLSLLRFVSDGVDQVGLACFVKQ
jgi:hypothetical protein